MTVTAHTLLRPRPASFAVLATALAATGYHLLLACGLLHETRRRSLPADLGAMFLAQVSACCWFVWHGAAPVPTGAVAHGVPASSVHLAMTLLTPCALRAAARSRPALSAMVQEALSALAQRLWALLSTSTAPPSADDAGSFRGAPGSRDEEAHSDLVAAGATGRRGPPWNARRIGRRPPMP